MTLDNLLALYRRDHYLPDPGPLYAVLGTVVGNLLPGRAVWLLLVGPPSAGKTDVLNVTTGLDFVHPVDVLTLASLLPGSKSRKPSDGGVLDRLGEFGILLARDFSSLLGQHHETRSQAFGMLRRVADGDADRPIGTDGGKVLSWKGKAGFLGASTEAIDQHGEALGVLGDRFLYYRMPKLGHAERLEMLAVALTTAGREDERRDEMAEAVRTFVEGLEGLDRPARGLLDEEELAALMAIADLTTIAGSAVVREGHDRRIVLVPDEDSPTRDGRELLQLAGGLASIGVEPDERRGLIRKVALDALPKNRRKVFDYLVGLPRGISPTASNVGDATGLPTTTATHALEELTGHEVLTRLAGGRGEAPLRALGLGTGSLDRGHRRGARRLLRQLDQRVRRRIRRRRGGLLGGGDRSPPLSGLRLAPGRRRPLL